MKLSALKPRVAAIQIQSGTMRPRVSSPLYRTARWLRRRGQQLRDEPLCRMCKVDGRVTAASVADHIEPHRNDEQKFWNGPLQSLCASCHSSRKQREEIGSVR